jgi:hypothetical protein
MQKNGLRELVAHRVDEDIRQSCWRVERTFEWAGHKIRVTVKNDSYEFQCDYFTEVFAPATLTWNRIYTAGNNDWHRGVDALSLSRMGKLTKIALDTLIDHLVTMAQDLLEGIPA